MQEYFKIGEVSKLYGIGVDSLRYYEKIGILHPERAESGYRHYSIQDIWKLNIIRDLRRLGFGMEQIRWYLEHHTVDSTLAMLEKEQRAIEEKIKDLKKLQENVTQRMNIIRSAVQSPLNVFSMKDYPPRQYYSIPEGYSEEYEMDVLIKRLLNMDREHLYVIGNNQIGTVISMEEACNNEKIRYQSVFVIDENGEKTLPGGRYLSVSYRGSYKKSREWVQKILSYAKEQHIGLKGNLLELLWIDNHTTADVGEYVTELQVLTEEL